MLRQLPFTERMVQTESLLITTKKGKEGDLRIHLTAQYGVAKIDKSTSPKVLNANQYLMFS